MNFKEREREIVDAIREGNQLYFGNVCDIVGKTVDIQDKASGRHFAGRVESAEFVPYEPSVGHDTLYFSIAGISRSRGESTMSVVLVEGKLRWKASFIPTPKPDDLVVAFR